MSLLVERLPRCLVAHSKGRMVMAGCMVLAAAVQWFCWAKRHPIVGELQTGIRSVDRLEEEVEKLERRWSEDEAKEVSARFEKLKEERLFKGEPGPGEWSEEVDLPEELAKMGAGVTLGASLAHPRHPDHLRIVSTKWSLDFKTLGRPDVPVILEFLKSLTTEQTKRMDLVGLAVGGDGVRLTSVELGVDLWFEKEQPKTY